MSFWALSFTTNLLERFLRVRFAVTNPSAVNWFVDVPLSPPNLLFPGPQDHFVITRLAPSTILTGLASFGYVSCKRARPY